MISGKQEELLRHMLGADERYKKKQWGFRNHFCADPDGKDYADLEMLDGMGLVRSGMRGKRKVFWATKEGAVAIGFKPYQLRNTDLAK